MKIIAVMGSPKGKGAGYAIVRKIEARMKARGNVEFSYLFLKDADLRPCTGCYTCMAHGEDNCPLKDDRQEIEKRILAADGIILSTPVHVANVSSLMKNFIDRFAYRNHRPLFFRQKVLAVINMAGTDTASLNYTLGGSRIVRQLAVQTPPWPQTERAIARKERDISEAAESFYSACLDGSLPAPSFSSHVTFFMMQQLSVACKQYLPADFAYYQGKSYYYDVKINIVKAGAARLIATVLMKTTKWRGPGSTRWPSEPPE